MVRMKQKRTSNSIKKSMITINKKIIKKQELKIKMQKSQISLIQGQGCEQQKNILIYIKHFIIMNNHKCKLIKSFKNKNNEQQQVKMSQQQSKRIYNSQLSRLQNENYLLQQQLQDIRTKYTNLKKQQQIWQQINQSNFRSTPKQDNQKDKLQLAKVQQQFVGIMKQKQILQSIIRQQKQKIQDLKYTILQLKQLSQKQENVHQKQIQFLKFEINNQRGNSSKNAKKDQSTTISKDLQKRYLQAQKTIRELQQKLEIQKQTSEKYQQKLEKCSQIAKEMQEYYNKQLETKQSLIEQLENQLNKAIQSQNYFYDLQSPKTKINSLMTNEDCSSLKCSSVVSEYQQMQNFIGKNYGDFSQMQEKYQHLIEELKRNYQKQIQAYQEKVHYLTMKLEAAQAQNKYLNKNMSLSYHQQIQGFAQGRVLHQRSVNLHLSKASISQSLTSFTPKSQISSSIVKDKQHFRQKPKITSVKTPNKVLKHQSSMLNNLQGSSVIKSNRNSCNYQRTVLNESNY